MVASAATRNSSPSSRCVARKIGGHMKKAIARVLVLVLLLESSSCAYLFHGTSDQINIYSGDPQARLYLNDQLIGVGNATATVDRDVHYQLTAKAPGCTDQTLTTGDKFDPTSLLGIFVDLGLISILVIDMAASGAAWKTYPLSYTVTPICLAATQAATPMPVMPAPAPTPTSAVQAPAPTAAVATSASTPAVATPAPTPAPASAVQAPAPIAAPAAPASTPAAATPAPTPAAAR